MIAIDADIGSSSRAAPSSQLRPMRQLGAKPSFADAIGNVIAR